MNKTDLSKQDVEKMIQKFHFSEEIQQIINNENLLPLGVLNRLNSAYPDYSTFNENADFIFHDKEAYIGLKGFREVVEILSKNGIIIDHLEERELFIQVYRFMVTKHILNLINWKNFQNDSLFQLVFPQPGMMRKEIKDKYHNAKTPEEKKQVINDYFIQTNPHDGHQKLNKPVFVNADGEIEIIEGSQHKYPLCQLIFDKETQNCFAFCSYCFRHAQVRGDRDMFIQKDISQVHRYLKMHKEVSDILITGGDAAYITPERFEEYIDPFINDPELLHIKSVRLGTRILTYYPEKILSRSYESMLKLFKKLYDNGIQPVIVAHFSTPRELLNVSTISAIRRLKSYGVTIKSQSPIMNHISFFTDENGKVDVDRSAQNWIDLANILAMLGVGFHSMYIARPTGEHHYFAVPIADINKVFNKIFRSLASINRPSRYITMTSSAGKISLLGTVEVNGETLFALKFNEARNMEWLDNVFLAQYDEKQKVIENLTPYESDKFFYVDELLEIENQLSKKLDLSQNKK